MRRKIRAANNRQQTVARQKGLKAVQYTNFERIKNMSVEELAEFIYSGNECGFCNQFGIDTGRKCDGDCVECIKHWLGLKTANNRQQINQI